MLTLTELQRGLREALLTGGADVESFDIAADGLTPEARLAIYRHHVFTSLTAALKATFPVVCRLVDERFFDYAADRYIRVEPPAGPCLFEYGAGFSDFLAEFPPCRHLPYLPDVARLEWAMNHALHAEDRIGLAPAHLDGVPAADMPRLTFTLDPSVSLLTSRWPVDRIWRANRPDEGQAEPTAVVDLDAGPARLQVRRIDGVVVMRSLDEGAHALRTALARGMTLEQAASAALAIDPLLDLTATLHEFLEERTAVDFAVSN